MRGLEKYDPLLASACESADVVVICTGFNALLDLQQEREKWSRYCKETPRILVGIEPEKLSTIHVPLLVGKSLALNIGAVDYLQCCIETGANVNKVFEVVSHSI
jgi:hypothetical protein